MNSSKILVIDDEIGICEGIKRALAPEGFLVDTAEDGKTGLKKVQDNGYELVLLDVMMPDISGIDLIGMIHDHDPEIVCITITGFATVELAVLAIKSGAYDFLTKPFSVDDLLLAVNQGIERRKLALEAKRAREMEQATQRLEEEKARLEELDRAKAQFIRLVTHELKTPVVAIQYYLELMREDYIEPDKQKEILSKCIARTHEEMDLIGDLLELGKLQVLDTKTPTTPISLDEVLLSVSDEFQERITEKGLSFDVDIEKNLPKISGFTDRYRSLWENLISNAIKYTPAPGKIAIKLFVEGSDLIGEIIDSGIGIPLEDQPKLFTEFFRAKNAKDADIQGTGLGLVIVKRVVEGAGGHLSVNSELGKGTSFKINLPITQNLDGI